MTKITQSIGSEYEQRVTDVLNREGLKVPGISIDFFLEDSKINLQNWLDDKEAFQSSGGIWLERETDKEIIGENDDEVWRIHFAPPYVVSDSNDGGNIVVNEISIVEPKDDFKHATMLAGIVGLAEYLAVVEAGYLPKPDILYGVTNETMAKFACRRLGFVLVEPPEDGLSIVATDFDTLKSATRQFIKKFGSKVTNLGLNEIESSGILND